MEITIKDWITYEESEKYEESCGGMGGWFNFHQKGHRWKDYIEIFDDEMKPYLEAIRKEVIKNGHRFGGDTHQNNMTPLFSDNTVGSFSFRAWGDLMAAIWSEEEDKDYCYTDFYMSC